MSEPTSPPDPLVVISDKRGCARLSRPNGCRQIQTLLTPPAEVDRGAADDEDDATWKSGRFVEFGL